MNALWHLLANSSNKQVANYLANNCSLAADNLQRCIFKATLECQPVAKYAVQGKMMLHNGILPPSVFVENAEQEDIFQQLLKALSAC